MLVESSEEYRVCHPDWPIDLLRVTVMHDELRQERYLRVKFQNVGEKVILSLRLRFFVEVEQEEKPLELVHAYPQRISPGESGGLSYSIAVGNRPVRGVLIQLVSVTYAGGEREETFSSEGIAYQTGEPRTGISDGVPISCRAGTNHGARARGTPFLSGFSGQWGLDLFLWTLLPAGASRVSSM